MGGDFTGRLGLYRQFGSVTGACWQPIGRIGGVRHIVVTDIVRDILTDIEVIGVIDVLIRIAVGIGTGVEDFQGGNTTFRSPVKAVEVIVEFFGLEALYLKITEVGVSGASSERRCSAWPRGSASLSF